MVSINPVLYISVGSFFFFPYCLGLFFFLTKEVECYYCYFWTRQIALYFSTVLVSSFFITNSGRTNNTEEKFANFHYYYYCYKAKALAFKGHRTVKYALKAKDSQIPNRRGKRSSSSSNLIPCGHLECNCSYWTCRTVSSGFSPPLPLNYNSPPLFLL